MVSTAGVPADQETGAGAGIQTRSAPPATRSSRGRPRSAELALDSRAGPRAAISVTVGGRPVVPVPGTTASHSTSACRRASSPSIDSRYRAMPRPRPMWRASTATRIASHAR